jgi:hypothetical protein
LILKQIIARYVAARSKLNRLFLLSSSFLLHKEFNKSHQYSINFYFHLRSRKEFGRILFQLQQYQIRDQTSNSGGRFSCTGESVISVLMTLSTLQQMSKTLSHRLLRNLDKFKICIYFYFIFIVTWNSCPWKLIARTCNMEHRHSDLFLHLHHIFVLKMLGQILCPAIKK